MNRHKRIVKLPIADIVCAIESINNRRLSHYKAHLTSLNSLKDRRALIDDPRDWLLIFTPN